MTRKNQHFRWIDSLKAVNQAEWLKSLLVVGGLYLGSSLVEVVDGVEGMVLNVPAKGRHAAPNVQPGDHDASDEFVAYHIPEDRSLQICSTLLSTMACASHDHIQSSRKAQRLSCHGSAVLSRRLSR